MTDSKPKTKTDAIIEALKTMIKNMRALDSQLTCADAEQIKEIENIAWEVWKLNSALTEKGWNLKKRCLD